MRKLVMGSILLFFVGIQMFNCGEYSPSNLPEHAETKELISLVKKAAALVVTKGEEAFAEFRKKDGEWFHGEIYVFVN
ncbi:MAG: sodium:calcium antiporter, partial [bacterium]